MQLGMLLAQLAQMRKEPLGGEERHDRQPEPQLIAAALDIFERLAERIQRRGDVVQQALASRLISSA